MIGVGRVSKIAAGVMRRRNPSEEKQNGKKIKKDGKKSAQFKQCGNACVTTEADYLKCLDLKGEIKKKKKIRTSYR